MPSKKTPSAYAAAGVDIDAMDEALARTKRLIRGTMTRGVAGDIGNFGGLFHAPGKGRLLVSSIDGVGTKLQVAHRAGVHDTVGEDLVNHCVNDVLTQGADPLFFMDYVGAAKLDPLVFEQVVKGLCRGCRRNGCALLGGETAEMPGLYPEGEYDLVGTIVGAVDRSRLVTGRRIRDGDALIGLPSSGLHTNGYSLARKIVFEQAGLAVTDPMPGTRTTVGRALLAVHKSYLKPVRALRRRFVVKGLAHITGGGLTDNLPRILPDGAGAVIDRSAWRVPPLFRFLREQGAVDPDEMYRVFNMGVGMVVITGASDAEPSMDLLRRHGERARVIGRIRRGVQGVEYA